MARMNLTDVKLFGHRAIEKAYQDEDAYSFCYKRILVNEYTRRYSVYEDIVRKSQELFNVQVFRDPYNISLGLYVVGKENFVTQYIHWVLMIIKRIEKDTELYGNPPGSRKRIHGNQANSNHAHKKAKQVLKIVFEVLEYKKIICVGPVQQRCLVDALRIPLYADEFSTLKNKTKYNGNLRNTTN